MPSAADRQLKRSVAAVNAAVDVFVAEARARLQADPSRRLQPHNVLEAMLVAADDEQLSIPPELAAQLEVADGDDVRVTPL